MLTILAKLWPAVPGALLAFGLSWLFYTAQIDALKLDTTRALAAQATELQASCEKQKHITEDVSNAYRQQVDSLNKRLGSLRLQHPAICVPVKPAVPTVLHGSAVHKFA